MKRKSVKKKAQIVEGGECSQCLEIKKVLYLTHYQTCYGNGEAYECSDCRMRHNLNDDPKISVMELKPYKEAA